MKFRTSYVILISACKDLSYVLYIVEDMHNPIYKRLDSLCLVIISTFSVVTDNKFNSASTKS